MTTKQITAANVNEQIKQLYQTAFPEDEQIPWEDLVRLIGEMHLDFTAYYEGKDFIGFTIVFPHEPFNWMQVTATFSTTTCVSADTKAGK